MTIYIYLSRIFSVATLITLLGGLLMPSVSLSDISDVPILQPGAPGNATRVIDAETAVAIANSSYTVADVDFMQDMVPVSAPQTLSPIAPQHCRGTGSCVFKGLLFHLNAEQTGHSAEILNLEMGPEAELGIVPTQWLAIAA